MRPCRVLEIILVLMVFPTSTVFAQQVLHGCVKNNNGQMRIVAEGEACLPSEHAVQWQAGAASAPQPLRVVDQNDVTVGLLASPNYAARLEGDVWVGLPVTAAGFQMTEASRLPKVYQSTDCSGDAYLAVDMNNMLRTGFVVAGAGGQPTFSYPGKPEVDRSAINSLHWGDWCISQWTAPAYMPLFGKMTTLGVSQFVGPFKVVQ